jgi:hypothetical protein
MTRKSTGISKDSTLFSALLLAVMATQPSPSHAASLSTTPDGTFPKRVDKEELNDIRQFLAGGPAHWAVAKPVTLPAQLDITKADGTLKNNAVVTYLSWVRSFDTGRFDRRHPKIASLFQHQTTTTSTQSLAAPATTATASHPSHAAALPNVSPPLAANSLLTSATVGTASSPSLEAQEVAVAPKVAEEVLAAPIPEPSSILTALAIFGLAGAWRTRVRAG